MTEMLRAADVPIGLVTDGRWWGIVSVPHPRTPTATTPEGDDSPVMPSSGIVDALTWVEESGLRDAFVALLDADRLVSGRRTDRLTALFVSRWRPPKRSPSPLACRSVGPSSCSSRPSANRPPVRPARPVAGALRRQRRRGVPGRGHGHDARRVSPVRPGARLAAAEPAVHLLVWPSRGAGRAGCPSPGTKARRPSRRRG